jgi:general secretion pathway protein M
VTSTQFLTILDDRLAKTPFKQFNYQLQQTESGDIKLSYDEVPFTAFIDWLRAFNQEYAFTTKQLTAQSTDTTGVVKLMVIFAMPNG